MGGSIPGVKVTSRESEKEKESERELTENCGGERKKISQEGFV